MEAKKLIIGLGVVGLAAYFLIKSKAQQITDQFKNIKFLPISFSNLNGKFNDFKPYVTFNIDLRVTNPTQETFNTSGVVVSLKRLLFYDANNNFIGGSEINLKALNIPAASSVVIPNVPILIDVTNTLSNVIKAFTQGTFTAQNIKTVAIIGVLGLEYRVE
jgi:hypothetical protein